MPRKQKIPVPDENNGIVVKKNKKNLINTMIKKDDNEEHIILQLPLSQQRINNLINNDNNFDNNLPKPYESSSFFINNGDSIYNEEQKIINFDDIASDYNNDKNICCFWCCHYITKNIYGMPHNYNSTNDTYLMYGSFCSLQCANAYNFSVHCGSDKVWEINSWIQILGKKYGYIYPIRPAPSRYLLKMFNGKLSIEEFRNAHINNDKTYLLNIPPLISIATNMDIINTSYLTKITEGKDKQVKKKYVNNNTIDSKLNLIIS